MPVLPSSFDRASPAARANRDSMSGLVADLHKKLDAVRQGGPERSREKHTKAGKLLARERVERLLDPGSPFLEIAPLAALDLYENDAPSAGIVIGIGRISERECVVVANDATVKGGTYYPPTVKKHLPGQGIALGNRLPCVYLV